MLRFSTIWKIVVDRRRSCHAACAGSVILICAAAQPEWFSLATLTELRCRAGSCPHSSRARPRSARRLVSAARGRCRARPKRAAQRRRRDVRTRCARQDRLYRARLSRATRSAFTSRATATRSADGAAGARQVDNRCSGQIGAAHRCRPRHRRADHAALRDATDRGAERRRGRSVDRDHPPPHRRDRHQGADDPAPGPGPHPGPGSRRRQSGARQGAARPHRQADLPAGRH